MFHIAGEYCGVIKVDTTQCLYGKRLAIEAECGLT